MKTRPDKPPAMQRIFIGIPIDSNARQKITELLKPLRNSRQEVRWVPENNWHLTLAFIGDKPGFVVENLVQVFDETYQHTARFQHGMSTLTRFPDPGGKIIALVDDAASCLHRLFLITLELLRNNNIEYCRKEFRPHITLGRTSQAENAVSDLDRRVNINLNIDRVVLYQSTPAESGPVYSTLKQTRLN